MTSVKSLLAKYGLRPRKALGQNFLIDRAALLRVVEAANLTRNDTVIEVGPGLGLLTRELLQRVGRVIAVEKDEALARLLQEELGQDPKLTVVAADMLHVAPESLLPGATISYKVVANLPYYVASPILRRFLESSVKPSSLVVLLQREVADNVAAKPGKMGLLSLAVQYYAVPTVLGIISPESFYPPPKVVSAIVRLDVLPRPAIGVTADALFRVARAAFSAKRKQIATPLSLGLHMDKAVVIAALRQAAIAPERRAESLSLTEWEALCRALPLLSSTTMEDRPVGA
ncbi:MAG: ksgA [Dehalococcoidia bacterium]|nr:ksgA [Dehalococcoidia bacterium]